MGQISLVVWSKLANMALLLKKYYQSHFHYNRIEVSITYIVKKLSFNFKLKYVDQYVTELKPSVIKNP